MMNAQTWILGLLTIHLFLNAASQFLSPPGLPFPFPPQMPDGASMSMLPVPPMPILPPQPLSPQSLPIPIPMSIHQPRLPVMVMPYYPKNKKPITKYAKKKRRAPKRHFEDSSSDSEGSESASNDFEFRTKTHPKKGRRQVLIPVVSYITKDGYVVYQKRIKKERAKDWLELGKKKNQFGSRDESGEILEDYRKEDRLRVAKKRSHDD